MRRSGSGSRRRPALTHEGTALIVASRQLRAFAEFYRRKSRNAEALQLFDALLARTPADPWVIARRAATAVALKATQQRARAGHSLDGDALRTRYGSEIETLHGVLEAEPADTWVHCQLIEALRCAHDVDACIRECDRLIERSPGLAWAYRRRAWAQRHRFNIEAALADVNASLVLQEDGATRGYRALLQGLLGNMAESQREFETILAQSPGLIDSFGLERALFWVMVEDYGSALPWLRRRYARADDYVRLYLLTLAVTNTHGANAARHPTAAARRAAAALLHTEARPLAECLLAALALLQGEAGARAELERLARLDPTVLELVIVDPSMRRAFSLLELEVLLQARFGAQIPTFLNYWMRQ